MSLCGPPSGNMQYCQYTCTNMGGLLLSVNNYSIVFFRTTNDGRLFSFLFFEGLDSSYALNQASIDLPIGAPCSPAGSTY